MAEQASHHELDHTPHTKCKPLKMWMNINPNSSPIGCFGIWSKSSLSDHTWVVRTCKGWLVRGWLCRISPGNHIWWKESRGVMYMHELGLDQDFEFYSLFFNSMHWCVVQDCCLVLGSLHTGVDRTLWHWFIWKHSFHSDRSSEELSSVIMMRNPIGTRIRKAEWL